MLKFEIEKCPFDEGVVFFKKRNVEIKEGLTVLVGCNGYGKTTFLNAIERRFQKDEKYKIIKWNGRHDKEIIQNRLLEGNIGMFAATWGSSEGEEINNNIAVVANDIGRIMRGKNDKDIIILLDCMDSGLSIDNIIDAKDFFKSLVIEDIKKSGHKCYIIASANEYELANKERCYDIYTGKELTFSNYDKYKHFIMKTRRIKDER